MNTSTIRLIAMIGSLLVAFISGVLMAPEVTVAAAAEDAEWHPVSQDRIAPPPTFDASTAARWTGESGDSSSEPQAEWTLIGLTEGSDPVALFQGESGRPPLRLRVGDKLADGSAVVAIAANAVSLEKENCRRTLSLFTPSRSSGNGHCETP